MSKRLDRNAAQSRLRECFDDLVMMGDGADFIPFCRHAQIALPAAPDEAWPAFLANYLSGNRVAEDALAYDLATFPPIAARVRELRKEAAHG